MQTFWSIKKKIDLENACINSIKTKSTFQCVILFSFIYLCSTLFQNLFEPDCFSPSVSNLPEPPLYKAQDVRQGGVFWLRLLGDSLGRSEPSLQTLVRRLTSHTPARGTQVTPYGRMLYQVESVIKPPSWPLLRTSGFWTICGSPLCGTDLEAAFCLPWRSSGLSRLRFTKLSDGWAAQMSCDRSAGPVLCKPLPGALVQGLRGEGLPAVRGMSSTNALGLYIGRGGNGRRFHLIEWFHCYQKFKANDD